MDNNIVKKVQYGIMDLLKYIAYFETSNPGDIYSWEGGLRLDKNTYSFPYPVYSDKFHDFIEIFYNSGLSRDNNLSYIYDFKTEDFINGIEEADFELLRFLLTYYIKKETFCPGFWADAIENKIFLKILYRMEYLIFN